jgi:hypothetical protein
MTNQQREELQHLKREANSPKSDLIDLIRKIEEISPKEAENLTKIVAKLESWQWK